MQRLASSALTLETLARLLKIICSFLLRAPSRSSKDDGEGTDAIAVDWQLVNRMNRERVDLPAMAQRCLDLARGGGGCGGRCRDWTR